MRKRIAIIAPGYAWLPGESGTSRFSYLAGFLAENGYEVDLIGSTFQHFKKAPRDIAGLKKLKLPYNLIFIEEPGYKKNVDLRRIYSNYVETKNTIKYLNANKNKYDLIYCVIPPNVLSAKVGKFCRKNHIPYIVDVEDLWPEAMRMVFKIPVLNHILFLPYWRDAEKTYSCANGIVGTSDEYTQRAFRKREKNIEAVTVYVGTEVEIFDEGVQKYSEEFPKETEEFWVTYAGSIGASYDIKTLIDAAKNILQKSEKNIRFFILGTGSLKEEMEAYAAAKGCSNVKFLGYVEYQKMAAFLAKSNVLINSYIKNAPQSIVTKIGDYLSAAKPMINTCESPEFCRMVETEGFGVNVEAENVGALVEGIMKLYEDEQLCREMSANARRCAEEKFDRKNAYRKIVEMVERLT